MKTIDVRLTFKSEVEALAVADALAAAANKWSEASKTGPLLNGTAEAIRVCVDRQREVREGYEKGLPFTPRPAYPSIDNLLRRKS
jgi:hypothetical protein